MSGIAADFSGGCDGFCGGFSAERDGFCNGFCGDFLSCAFPSKKRDFVTDFEPS